MFQKLMKFLKDVRAEMHSVSWPTKADLTEGTTVVITMSIIVSVFLSLVDVFFRLVMNRVIFH